MDKRVLILSGIAIVGALAVVGVTRFGGSLGLAQSYSPNLQQVADLSNDTVVPNDPDLIFEDITLTSQQSVTEGVLVENIISSEDLRQAVSDPVEEIETTEASSACEMLFEATAMPGAVVRLDVIDPCRGGEQITLHHQGMMFSAVLDETGLYQVDVPALAQSAVFLIESETGAGAVASVNVPDMATMDRVVLQWAGHGGFQIHALENGADYNAVGHVWHGSASLQGMGQVVRLGDADQLAPRMAEVYSVPASARAWDVAISIEAEITTLNCGRDISAQTFSIRRGEAQSGLRTRDLTLEMPECDAIGDFLVLNNLVENLKIAAN